MRTFARVLLLLLSLPLTMLADALASDWNDFLGPERNGKSQEKIDIALWGKNGTHPSSGISRSARVTGHPPSQMVDYLSSHATVIWRVSPAWKVPLALNTGGLNTRQIMPICTATITDHGVVRSLTETAVYIFGGRRDATLCSRLRR